MSLYIMHYGVGHDKGGHSGRYPWGSGDQPFGETHGKGKKDIWKEDRKLARKNLAKIGIGTALAGPIGTIVAGSRTDSSDLDKISKYNDNYADIEPMLESFEETIFDNAGTRDDPDWDYDSVPVVKKYIQDGLNKYKDLGSREKAIDAFLNEPRNKEIKSDIEYVKKEREKRLKEGIEFVKKMSDIYDLKTLYDIDTSKISPDAKRVIDNAKDFVNKVVKNDFPGYNTNTADIFKEYMKQYGMT